MLPFRFAAVFLSLLSSLALGDSIPKDHRPKHIAQATPPRTAAPTPTQNNTDETKEDSEERQSVTSRDYRAESHLTIGVEPFVIGTWVPNKRGVFATGVLSPDTSAEVEYLSGSLGIDFKDIDIAVFRETLLVGALRSYFGTNHFNLRYGIGLRKYELTLGEHFLTKEQSETVLHIETYIAALAVGNRWQWSPGFTLGVDWFEAVIPLAERRFEGLVTESLADPRAAETQEAGMRILRFGPTFNLLKLQLAWTF